ncbi:MAG TPA: hypothetical protein VE056_13560, partial [Pyrinomonadaceae bacterium]|nr:hypothetical protein [Pyrinomonadaceae bacterium]
MRQLFGVRWPGSALAGSRPVRPRLLEFISMMRRPSSADQSGAGPPHSKELTDYRASQKKRCGAEEALRTRAFVFNKTTASQRWPL